MASKKIYRNIYFHDSAIRSGNGTIDVYYSGRIFNNALYIKNINDKLDKDVDLYIICGSCASKKYRHFIKV